MNDPDGNSAAERMRDHGPEPWEEEQHRQICIEIVKDMLANDDQRAIEIFDELSDGSKAALLRLAFHAYPGAAGMAVRSYAMNPFIEESAWEIMRTRNKEDNEDDL